MLSREIRQFIAVVESKSINSASQRLNVSQPSVSKTLQNLEYELGVQLFERSIRGVNLTPEGEILYEHALKLLEEEGHYLKHANEDLDSIVRGINEFKGNVHISIHPPMSFQEGDEHKEIADKITETILKNYKLQPSNIVAHSLLENEQVTHNFGAEQIRKAEDYFQKRLKGLAPKEEKNLLMQYANPVISKRT